MTWRRSLCGSGCAGRPSIGVRVRMLRCGPDCRIRLRSGCRKTCWQHSYCPSAQHGLLPPSASWPSASREDWSAEPCRGAATSTTPRSPCSRSRTRARSRPCPRAALNSVTSVPIFSHGAAASEVPPDDVLEGVADLALVRAVFAAAGLAPDPAAQAHLAHHLEHRLVGDDRALLGAQAHRYLAVPCSRWRCARISRPRRPEARASWGPLGCDRA